MHIPEGIVSAPVLASGIVLTAVGTGIGLIQTKTEDVPKVAMFSAVFFVASLITVPLGLGSIHLVLNGLLGIILGWKAFPSILVALFLQAILFQYGGIVVLGVNVFIMAFPALVVYLLFRNAVKGKGNLVFAGGFLSGSIAVLLSAILLWVALVFSKESMHKPAMVIVLGNIPIILIEGIVTGFAVAFLRKVKPEVFGRNLKLET